MLLPAAGAQDAASACSAARGITCYPMSAVGVGAVGAPTRNLRSGLRDSAVGIVVVALVIVAALVACLACGMRHVEEVVVAVVPVDAELPLACIPY